MYTLAEHFSDESKVRLLPSLYPFAWQSLSAPALQSGAPLAATGQPMRPVAIEDGLARRDRLSPASLARALRSSMVSLGLLMGGRIDKDFSNNFPISLSRPGFSSGGGAGGGAGSLCWGADRSGAACKAGASTPAEDGCGDGGGADCGHAT